MHRELAHRRLNPRHQRRHMNAKRRAASLLLGVVLAACAGTPGSPTPAGSLSPVPSPTPITTPGPTAPSRSATPPSAAPTLTAPSPSPPGPTAAASGLPAGWHHELVCREDGTGCQLHLYDVAGREQPGWPRDLVGGCWSENVAVGSDGVAYVACTTEDEQTVVRSFAVTGSPRPGWPVEATGWPGVVHVGPDGTVYVETMTGPEQSAIHAFGPDGRPRSGWPRTLPGLMAQGFTLAPDGTVVGWWYEDLKEDTLGTQAARTKYTMIGPDGQTLPGRWPITSIGTATAPVIAQDGSLFYVSATGKVWGHDRSGNVIDGWPYQLPYPWPWPPEWPPELRPDGTLMFILGGWTADDGTRSDSEVIVLTTSGRVASGWPYRTNASLDGVRCCIDCYSYFPHAVSADGTLYLAPWTEDRAEVVALDRRGQVVTGWPYRLPAGSRVVELEMGSAGRLAVTLQDCSAPGRCCDSDASRQITLTPAGELAP